MPPAWRNQMTPNYGRAVGAIGSTSLPYAGGSLGVAGPATAAQGMTAGMSMRNPMSRAPMNNNPMGVQAPSQLQGVGNMQQAARNVMMQQPPGANTAMRPLNMPGMQFDASRNAMVPNPRTPLMRQPMDPYSNEVGRLSGGNLTRSDDQRWSRMARQAGVRPQDMAQWRALKIKEGGGLPGIQAPQGSQFVGPIKPPGVPPANQVVNAAPQAAAPGAPPVVNPLRNQENPEMEHRQNRNQGYFAEALSIQNDPGASLAKQAMRSLALGANVAGSALRDGFTNLVQGTPASSPQIQQARLQNGATGVPKSAGPGDIPIGNLRAMNPQAGQDPTEAFLAKWRGQGRPWNGFNQAQVAPQPWRGWGG